MWQSWQYTEQTPTGDGADTFWRQWYAWTISSIDYIKLSNKNISGEKQLHTGNQQLGGLEIHQD